MTAYLRPVVALIASAAIIWYGVIQIFQAPTVTPDQPGPAHGGADRAAVSPSSAAASTPIAPAPDISSPIVLNHPADLDGNAIVFANDEGLWRIGGGTPSRRLVIAAGISTIIASPTGKWIAWLQYSTATNPVAAAAGVRLHDLWVMPGDGTGGDARLVLAAASLPAPSPDQVRQPDRLAWSSNPEVLVFNTRSNYGGMPAIHEDAWTYNARTGELQQILPDGSAASLAFSPDGRRVAAMRRAASDGGKEALVVYNVDGTDGRVLLELGLEFAASALRPSPFISWTLSGDAVLVAAPQSSLEGMFDCDAGTTDMVVVEIPLAGSPGLLGCLPKRAFHRHTTFAGTYEPLWSPNAGRLAIVDFGRDLNTTAYPEPVVQEVMVLKIARRDGADPVEYDRSTYLGFVGWAPEGERFLYLADDRAYIGQLGEPRLPIRAADPIGLRTRIRWLGGDAVLVEEIDELTRLVVERVGSRSTETVAEVERFADVAVPSPGTPLAPHTPSGDRTDR